VSRVLVVGGGVTGLSAAIALSDADTGTDIDVEVWEASPRLGGKIATSPFAGVAAVDEGADAFLVRQPSALRLAERAGLGDAMTAPTAASASVWRDGLHRLPAGIVLGVPGDVRALAASGLLSPIGKLRAAIEPVLPRRDHGDSIGRLIRARFGDEVHERLVDALIGSIYAADTDHFSLTAVPQLADLALGHRSLLIGARGARRRAALRDARQPTGEPAAIFGAPCGGMGALIDAARHYAESRGVAIHAGRAATVIAADRNGWRVDDERFDAVVVAAPARATAALMGTVAAAAAEAMARVEEAGVVMVRLAVPGDGWPERLRGLSGYLVPKPEQRTVTACSFASQKWAHWQPADGSQILRISLGRDGMPVDDLSDDEAATRAIDEVGSHLGVDLQPSEVSVTRWPAAFPQYRPYHHDLVTRIESALPAGIAVAGSSYHGIGIPACVSDGRRAALQVVEALRA
jgi:protoporphyrinogen/coproporphyrinogen III oxidase